MVLGVDISHEPLENRDIAADRNNGRLAVIQGLISSALQPLKSKTRRGNERGSVIGKVFHFLQKHAFFAEEILCFCGSDIR